MADGSPQLEDGHIRIANELYDAILLFPFGRNEAKVMYAILRKTYGFGKKQDDMTVTQLANMSGISRPRASEALGALVEMNAVRKTDGAYGYVLSINKIYADWGRTKNVRVRKTDAGRTENVRRAYEKRTHKRQSQKTTPKECANGFESFWKIYPKRKNKGQAEKAWQKLKPTPELIDQICAAIAVAKTTPDWQKQNGQFVPYPATWLNAKGWLDDAPRQSTPTIFGQFS